MGNRSKACSLSPGDAPFSFMDGARVERYREAAISATFRAVPSSVVFLPRGRFIENAVAVRCVASGAKALCKSDEYVGLKPPLLKMR